MVRPWDIVRRMVAAVVLITLWGPVARQAAAQTGGRWPPVPAAVVIDSTGKVVGRLLSVHSLGLPTSTAGTTGLDARQAEVGVVALEVNQQVLHVGVATDRFVGAPILTTMNGGSSSQILSVPMNLVLFDAAGCTGNACILSFMVSDTAAPTPYAPGLLPRAAVGPGNTLYVETGVATTAQVLSLYFPFESFCQTADPPTPIAYPVVTATLEADLDELFKPPFHVEMR